MNCKTCKYWGEPSVGLSSEFKSIKLNNGKCKCPKIYHISSLEEGRVLVCDQDIDEVILYDYEEYFAAMYPGPNFGCIHWEARDEQTSD